MKKRNLLLSICCSLFALLCVGGCTPPNAESKEGTEILLAGFESYEEMITYHYTNYFGSAKPSKEYVTQGESGAALAVNGRYSNTQKPALIVDTKTELLRKSDFSDVSAVKIDVRNDNAYPVNMYLQYASQTETGLKLSSLMKQTLDVGFTGTVTYQIDRILVSAFLDLQDVTQLRLVFDAPKDAIPNLTSHAQSLQNYRKLHIDNFRAVLTETQIETKKVRKEGEIESGDKAEYLAAWYMPSSYVWSPSSLSFNSDPAYIKGGSGSLRFCLEGSAKAEGENVTARWEMSINQNADISAYHAVGFWLYNAEKTQPINLYSHSTVNNAEKFIKTLDYGWNYLEFTVNDLRDNYGFDVKNFLFSFVAQFKGGANYDLYLDEMYAISATTPDIRLPTGENVGNLYYKRYDEGAQISLPVPTVLDAEGYEVKVVAPNGQQVTVENGTFVPAQKGEYTVTYTATAKYPNADGEKEQAQVQILLAVGSVPTFSNAEALTTEYEAPFNQEYTITPHARSNDGLVSWKVVTYGGRFNGVCKAGEAYAVNDYGYVNGVMDGDPERFYAIRGVDHRIIYTVTNTDGLRAQLTRHVYADEPSLDLSARYENQFYDANKISGNLGLTETGDGFTLLSNGTKATGKLNNSLLLGYQVRFLRFMVYNAGDYEVKFVVNEGMVFTVAPKAYALFNPDSFGYKEAVIGWKMASAESKMLPLTFTATSEKEGINLVMHRFSVNQDAFGEPTLIPPLYESFYEKGTRLTVGNAVVVGLQSYSFKVFDPDGKEILSRASTDKLDKSISLAQAGEYQIVYQIVYADYDGETKEKVVTVTFTVVDGTLDFIQEKSKLVEMTTLTDGEYTLQDSDLPDLTNAEIVGWKVYEFHRDYRSQQGDEIYSARDEMYERETNAEQLIADGTRLIAIKPQAGYSYRIEYTLAAYGEQFPASKTLSFVDNGEMLELSCVYADFYKNGTVTNKNLTVLEQGIRFTADGGVQQASGEFRNAVSLGNLERITLVFRNDSLSDTYVYFHGAPENNGVRLGIKAKHYATLELYGASVIRAWGFADENNIFGGLNGTINRLAMDIYSPTNAVDITLCGIYVNASAFLPVLDGVHYEREYYADEEVQIAVPETLVNVTAYTVTVKKAGETEPAFVCTNTEIGTANGKFVIGVGVYEITYTVTYELAGESKTYEKTVTVTGRLNINDPKYDGLIYDKWQNDEAF